MAPSARRGFWIFVSFLATFAAAKAVLFDTLDPDCFWHLKVADQLCRQGIGPVVDDLSFASIRTPWTPYSWLAELGMKAVWDAGGFRAAVAVQAAVQGAIVFMLALVCVTKQRSTAALENPECGPESDTSSAIAVAAGLFLMLPYLSFRPVTFGFLILLTIAWLQARGGRGVWWIVPLTALYANVHLFVFFVPLMVFLSSPRRAERLGRRFFSLRTGRVELEMTRRQSRSALWLTCLTTLAALCTPMLPGLLRSVWNYSAHDPMVAGPVIAEMHGLIHGAGSIPAVLIVIGMITCAILGRKKVTPGRLILIGLTAVLSLKLGRFLPLLVIVAVPAVAVTPGGLSDRVLARKSVLVGMCAAMLLLAGKTAVGFPDSRVTLAGWVNRHGDGTPGYPCGAADFVDTSVVRNSGHVINEFSWGGYLGWRLGPRYQVLLDGRTQVFSPELWHATYLGTDADKARFLSKADADAAVLPTGHSEFRPALIGLGWTSVYRDDRAEVLIPPPAVGTDFVRRRATGETYASGR